MSSQQLVNNNSEMIDQYSSAEQLSAAIRSYGLSGSSFLDSGSEQTNPTPQPNFIQFLTSGSGDETWTSESQGLDSEHIFEDGAFNVVMAVPVALADISDVRVKFNPDSDFAAFYQTVVWNDGNVSVNGDKIILTKVSVVPDGTFLQEVELVIKGVTYKYAISPTE